MARAGRAAHQAAQERGRAGRRPLPPPTPKLFLNALPDPRLHDGFVFALVDLLTVAQLADVHHVGEQLLQRRFGKGLAAAHVALAGRPALGGPAAAGEFPHHRHQSLAIEIELEDGPHSLRLGRVDDALARPRIDVEAQQRHAAHPLPLTPRRRDLVPRPFADDLTLELRKRQQHVQDQPAHRRRRIELLRDRHESDAALLEALHHLGEIEERSTQPIELVTDHDVDGARIDIGEETLQRRPLHVGARVATVVVGLRQADPAGLNLALNEGLARRPLGIERVELLIEAFFGRLARVDGASGSVAGSASSCLLRRAKPEKEVAIAVGAGDRLGHGDSGTGRRHFVLEAVFADGNLEVAALVRPGQRFAQHR